MAYLAYFCTNRFKQISMRNYYIFFTFILSLSITIILSSSCKNENKRKIVKNGQGWLPEPEYQPKNDKARQLNDSAAALQVQALQDPTLDELSRSKMLETAFKLLNEALEIDPKYTLAMSNLSALYLEKRDSLKALELMKRRLNIEPQMAEGWQALGVFTDLMGDSINAIQYYEKSISILNDRLKMGKNYSNPDDILYYYDNWSAKSFSLLLQGKTVEAHNSIKALLDEAGVVMGENANTYAAMLSKDRWSLLNDLKSK
jgi:tetratricopeptide (TPR) repeat protein